MPRIPADVPLAWLSTRSLMDYCMGLGQWKYARDATALTLADLPLLQSDPAAQEQVQAMVQRLLPGVKLDGPDAADALAVAITHAHHLASAEGMMRRARVMA